MLNRLLGDFSNLHDLKSADLENIKRYVLDKLYMAVNAPSIVDIKKSPLGFFQLEFFKNNFGKVKLHYYPLFVKDIYPHWHGGDIRSIILRGQITQYKYLYKEVDSDKNRKLLILEEMIARSVANSINKIKLSKEYEKQFGIKTNDILDLDNNTKQLLLSMFTTDEIERFSVKYNINPDRGITYPEGLYFINDGSKEIFGKGDNYFLGKGEIHKVETLKDTVTLFMIEKNPIGRDGKIYNAGPFKTIRQPKGDKIELKSKVLNELEKETVIKEIIKLLK